MKAHDRVRLGAAAVVDQASAEHGGAHGAAEPEMAALGEQLYAQNCTSCHGVELKGQPDWKCQLSEGRTQEPSEALPIIWEEWPAFEEVALRGQEESGAVREIQEDGAAPQAVVEPYVALGRACGACHDRYREPNS